MTGTPRRSDIVSPDLDGGDTAISRLALKEFDWSDLVKEGLFRNILLGFVGAGLGLVGLQTEQIARPSWLLVDVALSGLCAALAFLRLWKTIREEGETAELWDEIAHVFGENDKVLDRVFEVPYLFAIIFLPFAAIAPQVFMVTLLLFYLADNYYNWALARGVADGTIAESSRHLSSPDESYPVALLKAVRRSLWVGRADLSGDTHGELVRYFWKRSRFNSFFMATLAIALFVVTLLALEGALALASLVCWLALGMVLLIELFVEPLRARGVKFE